MKSLFRALLLCIAAVVVSAPALASYSYTQYFWGTHGNLEQGAGVAIGSAIIDDYNFTLTSTSTLTTSAMEISGGGKLDMLGGFVTLFDAFDGHIIDGFNFDGTTPMTYTFHNLSAGSYWFRVQGGWNPTDGAVGVGYSFASALTAAPVPEPASLALMLAGLGALGLSARRRRLG